MQRLLNQVPINNIISQAETETETETETDTDTDQDRAELEHSDQFSGKTALIAQVQLGEYENAKRLLQAGADPNAATAGTPPPLGLQPARAPVCACRPTCVPRAC